jgi:carbon storage regulator
MLLLTRRLGEEIVIDSRIRIIVLEVHGGKVRLGVSAPPSIRVDRDEIHRRRMGYAGSSEPPASAAVPGFRTSP